MLLSPDCPTAITMATSTTSAVHPTTLAAGQRYSLVCSVASWIAQTASAPVAAASGAGSYLVPANTEIVLDPLVGVRVAVVGTTTGTATVTRFRTY